MEIPTGIQEGIGNHHRKVVITEPRDIGRETNMGKDGCREPGRAETIEEGTPGIKSLPKTGIIKNHFIKCFTNQ